MSRKVEIETEKYCAYEEYNSKDIFHKINEIHYEKLMIFYAQNKYMYVKSLYSYWHRNKSIIFSFLTFSNNFVHIRSENIRSIHALNDEKDWVMKWKGLPLFSKTDRVPCSSWRIFISGEHILA
jgi:hypothetical protein